MKKFVLLCSCAAIGMPFAAGVVAPTAAEAQQITTTIQGAVTAENGAPLGKALVTVTDTRTGATRSITADRQGLFTAPNLPTGGPYTVTAIAPGHEGQTVNGIVTSLQGATQLTFSLTPLSAEGTTRTIVVTAQRARVRQLAVGPGSSYGTAVMQNAPTFNRDVRDIIRMDPRVSLDRDDGGSGQDRVSCLGGNDRANTFTVDAIPQSDIYGLNDTGFSSRSSTPVPYDAVREAQVQFAPFDVEYGQFTGCAINVVTKGGTNRFHGSAFYEYSNNDLRGDKVDGRPVGPIKPDKRWGVSLGGPIWRDRLFFFGAYEHEDSGQSQDDGPAGGGYANEIPAVTVDQFNQVSQILSDVYGIKTGPLVHNRPFYNDRYFGRLDFQITDNQRLEATFQKLDEATMRPDDFFTGTSPQVTGENTFYFSGTHSKYYSARLYSSWTDRLSSEISWSHSDIVDSQDPVGGGEAQSGNPIPRIIVGIDNPPLGSGPVGQNPPDATILAGPGTSRSANDLKTKVDIFKAVAKLEFGDHRLKLGAELNHANIFNLFVQNATGTLVFRNIADLQAGLLSPGFGGTSACRSATTSTQPFNVTAGCTFGAFGNFSATGDVTSAAAKFKRNVYSLYAQDDWQVTNELKAVLGVRVDSFSGGHPDLNENFVKRYGFPNTTGFSDINAVVLPRLGVTWNASDFSIFRRTRVTGGVGVFSGGDPLVWFGNAFQNNGFGFAQGTTGAAGCPAGQIDVVQNGQFTGLPECFRQAAVDSAARGLGNTQSIDPNIKLPTVWRANIGAQTDLNFADGGFFSNWRLNVDYIYSHYRNPYTIVDLSQTPDITQGLNGFTADGRPIYATIDPSNVGCNAVLGRNGFAPPVYTGVTAECFFQTNAAGQFILNRGNRVRVTRFDELMLTNSGSYDSHIVSAILRKNFDHGIFTPAGSSYFSLGYAFTAAHDRRNMYNSTAGSNYDLTAAFDRQNPDASRGFFGSRNNITFSGNVREEFIRDLGTSLGFTFTARQGRPYSLTFGGGGIFNNSNSGNNNALVYIPTGVDDPNIAPVGTGAGFSNAAAVQGLHDFAQSLSCARKYIGRSIKRNTCTNDWYYDLDLRLAQEIPGPGRLFGSPLGVKDKITVYAMFDNFLNFLDEKWNVQKRRNFSGLQDVASISGVDAQGRYIITGFNGVNSIRDDNLPNITSSVWRIKIGVSYDF